VICKFGVFGGMVRRERVPAVNGTGIRLGIKSARQQGKREKVAKGREKSNGEKKT